MADEELEVLRKKRLMELQAQQQFNQELAEQQETQAAQEYEDAKKKIMRAILTPEARERLTKIRMIRPEFADSIEKQLIALAQSGRIQNQIDDATLKQILDKITPKKREPTIRRG